MRRTSIGPGLVAYVFGAFGAQAVPGPAMIALLGDLGMAEPAARTLLSRMVRWGLLSSSRSGRIAVYRMRGEFRDRFLRFRESDALPTWDGGFEMVVYEIPETHRTRRDALRDTATGAGFGQLRPGVLIGLSRSREWLEPWLAAGDVFVQTGRFTCEVDTARTLADRAWGLTEKVDEHRAFLARLRRIERQHAGQIRPEKDAFVQFNDVMRAYALLHMGTPALPSELTPEGWPAQEIAATLRRLSQLLGPSGAAHAKGVADACGVTGLIVPMDA